ncbi:hypothetical protein GVN21_18565 [Caulobacter sp. SLTY]|nr:hypothetical protein [Caulobacter sp. SLTY]NBB17370.1 hypothetical protein [Caulobacter sp. SLTY]
MWNFFRGLGRGGAQRSPPGTGEIEPRAGEGFDRLHGRDQGLRKNREKHHEKHSKEDEGTRHLISGGLRKQRDAPHQRRHCHPQRPTITGSMERAMAETKCRREKQ